MSDVRPNSSSPTRTSQGGFLSALLPALFAGTLVVVMSASFAALIFPGEMSIYIPQGIALAMKATIIVGLGVALFSHCSPTISMADDDTAPVFALLASLVVGSLPAETTSAEMIATAIGAILLATVVAGGGLALLGFFKFGRLVQYLPYSVMGGYFAAVGWLLLVGGLQVATGVQINLETLPQMFDINLLTAWLPVVLLVGGLLFMERRIARSRLLPAVVFLTVPVWYALAMGLGYTPQELMDEGKLIGPFVTDSVSLARPMGDLEFSSINWSAVLSNVDVIGAIVVISALSMVLSISGLAILTREELDMDQELKLAGLSNLASGLGGGMTGLPSYSLSKLALDMGAPRTPMVGLLTVLICAVVFMFGLDIIAYAPRFLLGGLLVYLGVNFLYEWLFEAWYKFSRLEYLVIIIILAAAVSLGFLQGMFVGLAAAVVLFVVKYSQTKVIRFRVTGADLKSNVDRSLAAEQFIRENGDQVVVLGLQGFLFFGTAGHVYDQLADRAKDMSKERLLCAVMDFSQVTGLDSSAALNFQRLELLASTAEFKLLIVGLEPELLERLIQGGFHDDDGDSVVVLPDLDRAIEWCEDAVLSQSDTPREIIGCFDRFRGYLSCEADLAVFKGYLEKRDVEAGTRLTNQGDESRELFFVEKSAASAFITDTTGEEHRVRLTRQGAVYGEMGFYLGNPRNATVITDEPGVVYVLSLDSLAEMESGHAEIAGALHRYMAMLICERLSYTTQSLRAMLV